MVEMREAVNLGFGIWWIEKATYPHGRVAFEFINI
jgi:hypothetical protein